MNIWKWKIGDRTFFSLEVDDRLLLISAVPLQLPLSWWKDKVCHLWHSSGLCWANKYDFLIDNSPRPGHQAHVWFIRCCKLLKIFLWNHKNICSVTATTGGAALSARSRTWTSASTGRAHCSRTAPTPSAASTAPAGRGTRGTASTARPRWGH